MNWRIRTWTECTAANTIGSVKNPAATVSVVKKRVRVKVSWHSNSKLGIFYQFGWIPDYEEGDYEEGDETEAEEEEEKPSAAKEPSRESNSVLAQPEDNEPSHKENDPERNREEEEEEEQTEEDNEIPTEETENRVENHHHHTTTSTSAPIVDLCQTENGGCDHKCQFIRDPEDHAGRIECSCYPGFNLDEADGRTCHGESQISIFPPFS